MDREKQLLLNYVGNTLLIEKLHRFYQDLLEPTTTNVQEKSMRESMLVAQYQLLEEQNAQIIMQLLSKRENRIHLKKRTHNFSIECNEYDFAILSPGLHDTRVLPFANNLRGVNFLDELEKLVSKNLLEKYSKKVLKQNKIEK